MATNKRPLWTPSAEQINNAHMTRFMLHIEKKWTHTISNYDALYQWSIEAPEKFWQSVWEYCAVIAKTRGNQVRLSKKSMENCHYFPEAQLNYAENLLRRRDNSTAIVFWSEDKIKKRVTFASLYDQVRNFANALRANGVQKGDRVAGYLPNMPDTVIAMLATASIGAIWSSCSPDFGVEGVLDRFGQIKPKILICSDQYFYNGKAFHYLERLPKILHELKSVEHLIVTFFTEDVPNISNIAKAVTWDDFTKNLPEQPLIFEQLPFNHPLYIMYSSGTTGKPKCIIHGAGGTLIQHLKEHQLHCDIKKRDRVFYFTTCGWMMWNWLVSALASEATLLLYDGSPFYPDGNILFDFAEAEKMTHFGTAAKYIDAVAKANFEPIKTHVLKSLRMMASTGSPLAPKNFEFVYKKIAANICLASISGGTDIISCFVLGNPIAPVWAGELQTRGLGMAVKVYDAKGNPINEKKGELVCTKPFPSMPVGFWGDHKGLKYHATYFERYPNIWHHGDYVELTKYNGMIFYGRSDATLNPGGVRIGTAEIYRQVEKIDEVLESVAVGQEWRNDVRVILFVKLRPNVSLDYGLIKRIKQKIRTHTTNRHVPNKIIQITDIPRTINGKIVELAIQDVLHHRNVQNIEALANPEALELFKNISELHINE